MPQSSLLVISLLQHDLTLGKIAPGTTLVRQFGILWTHVLLQLVGTWCQLAYLDHQYLDDNHSNNSRKPGHVCLLQGVYGAGAHTDYGALTVLATDDSPGLQINTDGQWQHVKPVPGTFVINLGDMLERHGSFLRSQPFNALCK